MFKLPGFLKLENVEMKNKQTYFTLLLQCNRIFCLRALSGKAENVTSGL